MQPSIGDQGKPLSPGTAQKLTCEDQAAQSDLTEAIDNVIRASETQTAQASFVLQSSLHTIQSFAEEYGLPNQILAKIIETITRPNFFSQADSNTIVHLLYPESKVPSELIIGIVNSLGHGIRKPPVPVQRLLLRWIIRVYDVLEDSRILSSMYSVLFDLLDVTLLRAELCHILVRITSRKHVKPFRLQMLQDLSGKVGLKPPLLKLINLYDEYAPSVLSIAKSKMDLADFPLTDPRWAARLDKIQEKRIQREQMDPQFPTPKTGLRRSQLNSSFRHPKDLRDIVDVDGLVNEMETSMAAGLVVSNLNDQIVQQFITIMPDEAGRKKLDDLLSSTFKQFEDPSSDHGAKENLSSVLESVLAYSSYAKTLPHSAQRFLQQYLCRWDGQHSQQVILSLLSYLPTIPISELQSSYLDPLEDALLSQITDLQGTRVNLLSFYTALLQNWSQHLTITNHETPSPHLPTLLSLLAHTTSLCLTLLTTTPTPTPKVASAVLIHQSALLPFLSPPLSLPLPPPEPLIQNTLLFASPSLSTLSVLTSNLAAMKHAFESSLTSATTTDHNNPTLTPTPRPSAHIKALNGVLIDTCNLLFRSRAFNTTDANALGCCLVSPPSQQEQQQPPSLPATTDPIIPSLTAYLATLSPPQTLTHLFSLSHHPTLAALSIAAFREMEDQASDAQSQTETQAEAVAHQTQTNNAHPIQEGIIAMPGLQTRHAGPVTQKSLAALGREGGLALDWRGYRIGVVRWLEGMGADGVRALGVATMKLG